MDTNKLAKLGGWFFIGTFVTAIAARFFAFEPSGILDAGYVTGEGADTQVAFGAFFEFFLIVTNIGSAIAFFPVLKRYSEVGALGYLGARVVESVFIAVGLLALLALVLLRQEPGALGAGALEGAAGSLVAIYDRAFLMGPGVVVGLGNGLLLGWLMYRTGLVPRRMALIGIIGGPLAFLSGVLVLFGATEAQSSVQVLMTLPEIVWEASLGIYLVWKGFRQDAPVLVASSTPRAVRVPELV
jgi:hypothetical protein